MDFSPYLCGSLIQWSSPTRFVTGGIHEQELIAVASADHVSVGQTRPVYGLSWESGAAARMPRVVYYSPTRQFRAKQNTSVYGLKDHQSTEPYQSEEWRLILSIRRDIRWVEAEETRSCRQKATLNLRWWQNWGYQMRFGLFSNQRSAIWRHCPNHESPATGGLSLEQGRDRDPSMVSVERVSIMADSVPRASHRQAAVSVWQSSGILNRLSVGRAQNFSTIALIPLKKLCEVADAIAQGMEALREELGDLLLQVVFHSPYGRRSGLFDFAAVAEGISNKLIRRHPHVLRMGQSKQTKIFASVGKRQSQRTC